MQSAPSAISPDRLAEVLLAFGRAPGHYPVRLGEPRELHAHLDVMAAWALGRLPPELQSGAHALREAAVLFIQRACFAPGNTYYQVFGLKPKTLTPEVLRSRYRTLIRLTHPDMGVQGLPPNAAGIVNRAHEVLSDPALRENYDEGLAERAAESVIPTGVAPLGRIQNRVGLADRWRSLIARYPNQMRVAATVLGASLLVVVLLLVAANEARDGRTLVLRESGGAARPTAAGASTAGIAGDKPSWLAAVMSGGERQTAASEPAAASAAGVDPAPSAQPAGSSPKAAADASVRRNRGVDSTVVADDAIRDEAKAAPVRREAATDLAFADEARILAALPERRIVAQQSATAQAAAARPGGDSRAPYDAMRWAEDDPAPPAAVARRPAPAAPSNTARSESAAAGSSTRRDREAPRSGQASNSDGELPASTSRVAAAAPARTPTVDPTPIFAVDTQSAKHYLVRLISSLERPGQAHAANVYLIDRKVVGSLLHPPLHLMASYPDVVVERMRWTDQERPGVLKVQGVVVLHLHDPQAALGKRVSYRLSAEFWGTATGTVLAQLDLKESH